MRGLRNTGGEYNCFLNVIIQSLWHLSSFRAALLAPRPPPPAGPAGAGADARVLRALRTVFEAMAAAPQAEGDGESAWLVDPCALREALSRLGDTGAAVIGMELSEMHDAAEVFDEVLAALHRAEVPDGGAGGEGGGDPRLPRRVRARGDVFAPPAGLAAVRLATSAAPAAAAGNGSRRSGSTPPPGPSPGASGSAGGGGGVGRLGGNSPAARSMVHRVFGLDVQVAAPPDDDGAGNGNGASRGGAPALQSGDTVDAQQFLKFAHFVHAEVLRQCYDRLFDGAFSDVLCAADIQEEHGLPAVAAAAAAAAATAAGAQGSAAARAKQQQSQQQRQVRHATGTRTVLLRRPQVFTLALIWDSPQVSGA